MDQLSHATTLTKLTETNQILLAVDQSCQSVNSLIHEPKTSRVNNKHSSRVGKELENIDEI